MFVLLPDFAWCLRAAPLAILALPPARPTSLFARLFSDTYPGYFFSSARAGARAGVPAHAYKKRTVKLYRTGDAKNAAALHAAADKETAVQRRGGACPPRRALCGTAAVRLYRKRFRMKETRKGWRNPDLCARSEVG